MKKIFTLIGTVALAVVLLMVSLIPLAVSAAATYPDLTGYYECKCNLPVYDMDGTRVDRFRYIGILVGDQTDNILAADDCTLYLMYTNSARGSKITEGTGDCDRIRLELGNNTITVNTVGTFNVYLPDGLDGTATSGTTTVTSSPKALVAGDNTVTTTGIAGTFTLNIALDPITIGTLTGVVGEGSKARFQMVGSSFLAEAVSGTATLTGSPVTCYPPTNTLAVSVEGTVLITLPEGLYGTATSGTSVVTGSPLELLPGENTVTLTGVGNFTVDLQASAGYTLSGYVRQDKEGNVSFLVGRIDGFVIIDHENWEVLTFGNKFRGSWEVLD